MAVWISVDRDEPRVWASVVVRAGAAEDPADATGVAHYLEHMLANKGTRRLGTRDHAAEAPHLAVVADRFEALRQTRDPAARARLRAEIEAAELAAQPHAIPNELKLAWARMGGRGLNATTSHERINVFVDMPAEMLPRWARLEQDRFSAPVFRAFSTEVRTICEEKSRALDQAGRASKAALARGLWGDHPYGRPVLGELAHLASPSVRAMEDFVARWMVPENMAVVLAGDVAVDEALALLADTLGRLPRGWTAGPATRAPRPSPPALAGEARLSLVHHGQGAVHIGWRTVPRDHPDAPALRMAELLLSNGRTGRIDQALVQTRRIRGGGAWSSHRGEGGQFVVWANPREGQSHDDAAALLLAEVAALARGAVDPAVLAAVHTSFSVAELQRLETNAGRGAWMTRAIVAGRSPAEARAAEARVRAVGVDEIAQAAARWLGPDRVRVCRHPGVPVLPAIEGLPPAPRPIETDATSPFLDAVLAMPAPPRPPRVLTAGRDYQRRAQPWGLTISNANPYSGLAQLQIVWDHGQEHDLLAATEARLVALAGVAGRSPAALALALHGMGVRTGMSVQRDATVLWLAGPGDQLGAAAALVRERLVSPVLDADARARELADLLASRRERRATRDARVRAARGFVLYGARSGMLARTPGPALLAGMVEAPLGARGQRLLALDRDQLVTGPVGPGPRAAFFAPGGRTAPPAPLPPWTRARAWPGGVYLLHHAGAQASVTVYRCAGPRRPGTTVAGAWLSAGLSGPGSLIFQELREARALAYSTGGGLSRGARHGDDDLLWGSASTEPPRAAEAARELVRLLRDGLPDLVGSAARVDRARARLAHQLGAERLAFRSVPGAVRGWGRLGHAADPRPDWRAWLAQAPADALADHAAGLPLGPVLVVVVGDLSRMDPAAFAPLGPVQTLSLVDVFGPDAATAPT